jgi:hypothetical protein
MSYPQEEVEINPKLSQLSDKVSFSFLIPKEYESLNNINVEIKIILDIVYLKEEVNISSYKIEIKDKKILIEINSFPLDKIDENKIINVATLNFIFKVDTKEIMKKILIIQIVKEKNLVYKNII